MAFGRNFPSTAMSEHERFSVPHEIDEILERLPPQVTLNVPDHILSRWFPPGPVDGIMEGRALARAQSYAQSCACRFAYHGSVREGSSISRYRRKIEPPKSAGQFDLHPMQV